MAGGNSKIVKEQSGFRAGHFTIRKKRTLASKRFLNVSVQTQTKLPMVTWADILCLLHLLYNVSNTGYELQIYQTKGSPPLHPPRLITYCCICKIWVKRRGPIKYYVKELLCRNGFGPVWLQQNVGHLNRFVSFFKQRLLDQFQQDWSASITSKEFLFDFQTKYPDREVYVDFLQLLCFRAYIKFRFGISPISVHRLRYRNDLLRDVLCPVCEVEIDVACSIFV